MKIIGRILSAVLKIILMLLELLAMLIIKHICNLPDYTYIFITLIMVVLFGINFLLVRK
jgi:5-enolpyruvylshikimate-3-phosphate synthase